MLGKLADASNFVSDALPDELNSSILNSGNDELEASGILQWGKKRILQFYQTSTPSDLLTLLRAEPNSAVRGVLCVPLRLSPRFP